MVSTLCDKKVDHETFLETVLLFAKYDNILKYHLEMLLKNICKTNPTSTSITVQTKIHLSPKLLLTLSLLFYPS